MGYVIMAYAMDGYQEFILPEFVDLNYSILIERQKFGLKKDLSILLENVDNEWRFIPSNEYKLCTYDGKDVFFTPLKDGMAVHIKGIEENKITLLGFITSGYYPSYDKYILHGINQITIGKDPGNVIEYGDTKFVSRNHAVLYKYGNSWIVQDNSSNGTYLNGKRINEREYLKFGDQITLLGLRLIFLDKYIAICALSGRYKVNDLNIEKYYPRKNIVLPEKVCVSCKKEYFKRAPRTIEKLFKDDIEIEAPPTLNKIKKKPLLLTIGPSLTMALPMMLGCMVAIISANRRGQGSGAYMFTGIITAISSAIIGVVWALINLKYSGKEEEENEELRYNAYGQYLIDIKEFIKEKYNENREVLFRSYISGHECCNIVKGDIRLWNRNERQKDFMTIRLGIGTIPFHANIKIPPKKFTLIKDDLADQPAIIRDTYKDLYSVPFCIDIRDKGIIGIIGGLGKSGAYDVAYNIIAQLAANNSYTDVKMVFIYRNSREAIEKLSFVRWLPHVWMEDKKTRLIACDKSDIGDIFYEMASVLRIRTEEPHGDKKRPLPHYVIFVDDASLIEGELLENYIYNPHPEYGITTIFLVEKYADLSNNCETIIQNDGTAERYFNVFNEDENSRDLILETVTKEELEMLVRGLCDVEINETSGVGEIPNSLDFFEMYDVKTLDGLDVIDRWKKNRNYENMRVPIGQKNGGAICYLDIHEKYHGPHGLIAGTTGSGKSETLQTYILSLAVNFSPDDIAFFIIDFKGGGMANLFADLPHMAGQISNLSGNQVRRAMISIKSENQRRQRIFAQHNVNNINSYTRLYKNHEAKCPIPHLFIIIDEFAELKREEPDFMKELISVAQVGRSLGVHLILATQKPSGTVDDNIWSNSKFRLCLRVQDKQDSNDMLHKPDAAYITQAGRGFFQVGNDEIYEQFQSGYSGAEYYENSEMNRSATAVKLSLTGRIEQGSVVRHKNINEKVETQLNAVIEYLGKIADRYNYNRRLLLWLPVLPKILYLDQLENYDRECMENGNWREHKGKWCLKAMIGLYDDPVNQAQRPLYVNFSDGGHLAVCGMVATGKSTFIQTLIYSMIQKYSPEELNYYVLDYSSRMMLPFEEDPHCGGIIIDTDEDKVNKFFYMINQMMAERKNVFKGGNYSQYIQAQNSKNEKSLPAIIIIIDNYSNFREKTNCIYDDIIVRLAREGVGYGIFIVISSAGFGSNELPIRVADNIRTIISLEMGDKFKYAEILRTTRVEIQPELDVKGRGLAYVDGNILEYQTALCKEAKDSYKLAEQIKNLCIYMKEIWKGKMAKPIPYIPEHPVFDEFCKTEEYNQAVKIKRNIPIGYLYQDASIYSIDLWNTYCYFIQGKERTGRKNVMKMIMYAIAEKANTEAIVIEPGNAELKDFAEQLNIAHISDDEDIYEFFKETIPEFQKRNKMKNMLMKQGIDNIELSQKMACEKQIFILLPDLVSFIKSVYKPAEGVGSVYAYLENITAKGSNHGFYFFGIISPEQVNIISGYNIYINMASYKTGMHLGGNISAQRFFQFNNISYSEQSKILKPGSAYVQNIDDSGIAETVILPLVKGVLK